MRLSFIFLGVVCSLSLMSCGDEPTADAKTAPPGPQSERDRQINNTQAASAVGYDGDALKRSVQKTVNTLENHTAETQTATQAATDSAGQAAPDASK